MRKKERKKEKKKERKRISEKRKIDVTNLLDLQIIPEFCLLQSQ